MSRARAMLGRLALAGSVSVLPFLSPWRATGEDLLTNQCGGGGCTAVPTGTWTDLTATLQGLNDSKLPYYVTGWDKAFYVPAIDRYCSLSSYWEPSSEPNRSWACYSFKENRWDHWDMGASWHNEHMNEGGHPMGWGPADPTTSLACGPGMFSGSQVSEQIKWGMWCYDFVGQVGIPRMPPSSLNQNNQLGTAAYDVFDQLLIGEGGDSSNQGTVQYDNVATDHGSTSGVNLYNSWALPLSGTTGGPPASIIEHSMTLNTNDKLIYLFGGYASGATQNWVWTYNPATKIWTQLSPTCTSIGGGSTCPVGRVLAGWAYNANENVFLMHGGFSGYGPPLSGTLTDTWVFDPSADAWIQQNPTTVATYGQVPATANERLVWMPEDDVFLLFVDAGGASTSNPHMWAYRLAAGGKAGYRSLSYSYTPGSLNRNTTGASAQSNAYGGAIASNGSTLYEVWTETATKQHGASPANSWVLHPYAQQITGGVVTKLGNSYNSMSADIGSSPPESFDTSMAVVGTTPWACWHQQNITLFDELQCEGWDGTGWNIGGSVIPKSTVAGLPAAAASNGAVYWVTDGTTSVDCTTGGGTQSNQYCRSNGTAWAHASLYYGPSQIANVNGIPTVAFRQQDRSTGNVPYPTYGYVQQWNGTAWTQTGAVLNTTGAGSWSVIDSLSIASDGTSNPWVAFTQYTPSISTSPNGVKVTAPQVYLYQWNGTNWVQQCGGPANITATDRTFSVSLTYLNQPYVAFVERTDVGLVQKLYVRTCSAGAWSTVGPGYLNRDQNFGWAFRPELTNDGSNLYLTWAEQGNAQPWVGTLALMSAYSQKPHVYVAKWNGTSWTSVGGALNADTSNGAATHPSIAILNGQPVVQWGEVNAGNLRQMYIKQWNGLDWSAVSSGNLTVTTSSLPAWTIGATYSQALAASGGTPPYVNWTIATGSLPVGCSLNSSTGVISGILGGSPGTSTFTVQVSDSAASPATATSGTLSITINAAPVITTGSPLPGGTVGTAYLQTLAATGGTPPLVWDVPTGSLPAGLVLSAGGTITGTPTQAGTFSFTARVTDAAGSTFSAPYLLTIAAPGNATATTVSGSVSVSGNATLR